MTITVINEARGGNLYHCTTPTYAMSILDSGVLKPNVSVGDTNIPEQFKGKKCISFTRDQTYTPGGICYIQFVFDYEMLSYNYKITSVVSDPDKRGADDKAGVFEAEERLFTDKPLPIKRYLKEIRLLTPDMSLGVVTDRAIKAMLYDRSTSDDFYILYKYAINHKGLFSKERFFDVIDEEMSNLRQRYKGEPLTCKFIEVPPFSVLTTSNKDFSDKFNIDVCTIDDSKNRSSVTYKDFIVKFKESILEVADSNGIIHDTKLEDIKSHIIDIELPTKYDDDYIKTGLYYKNRGLGYLYYNNIPCSQIDNYVSKNGAPSEEEIILHNISRTYDYSKAVQMVIDYYNLDIELPKKIINGNNELIIDADETYIYVVVKSSSTDLRSRIKDFVGNHSVTFERVKDQKKQLLLALKTKGERSVALRNFLMDIPKLEKLLYGEELDYELESDTEYLPDEEEKYEDENYNNITDDEEDDEDYDEEEDDDYYDIDYSHLNGGSEEIPYEDYEEEEEYNKDYDEEDEEIIEYLEDLQDRLESYGFKTISSSDIKRGVTTKSKFIIGNCDICSIVFDANRNQFSTKLISDITIEDDNLQQLKTAHSLVKEFNDDF